MIYVYLVICVGMIMFNIVSAVLSRSREKSIMKVSCGLENRMLEELRHCEESGEVREEHKAYLSKKLRNIGNMRAFDIALEREYSKNPELIKKYLHDLSGVFVSLAVGYSRKDAIEAAYFPYIIKKYKILKGRPIAALLDTMYLLLHEPSIYCRENAMQTIYTVGDPECVIKALRIVDGLPSFYHNKLLTDGLLNFEGNTENLSEALWENFEGFSLHMQIILLNYFRFSSGGHGEKILKLMTDESRDDEIRFACIRYFGKYRFDRAYEYLLRYADYKNDARWEYSAIASSALCIYPCDQTVEVLKSNLYNRNWYIRFNASQSLERLGLTYLDLIDIIEGKDRFASEILRYRLNVRDIIEEEKESIEYVRYP